MMNERARDLWARTRVRVWPEPYLLISLPRDLAAEAAALAARSPAFAAVVLERDEASLTLPEELWRASELAARARAVDGPFRALTLDLEIELDVCGYLAPAAERLARAGVAIVPQCAFRKDHLLVHARQLDAARRALDELMRDAQAGAATEVRR